MNGIRMLWLAALALAAVLSARAGDEGGAATKLDGTYTVVSGERAGKKLPESDFQGSVVRFVGNKIRGTDRDQKEFFGATFTLDTTRKPWVIHMTSTSPKQGEKADGVIEKDGDTVRLCYALPGGKAPTRFGATGEDQQSFVLKRLKE